MLRIPSSKEAHLMGPRSVSLPMEHHPHKDMIGPHIDSLSQNLVLPMSLGIPE